MDLVFEVTYDGDLLATIKPSSNMRNEIEALWIEHDEEYGLSDAYEEMEDWITELQLIPVYTTDVF